MGDWKSVLPFMAKYVPLWVIISAGIAFYMYTCFAITKW